MIDSYKKNRTSPSAFFLHALTLLFIALKLTGFIGWSWWWVLSPLWLPVVGAVILVALALLVMAFPSGRK